ncbi:Sensor histidine kinase YpdA [Pedobacter sp. Bi27]|uniref:sensor histidine kinase n=1 Tax=unclassified Pedobacter TaxID=2628915 RepID=UPI001D56A09E|nr:MULTISPECIES: sensor histidine kinase [unclassified Pedobacter]CAH0160215.1 Sensor histidine kinase YpdA [Pedobacter sp. Bi126]CAH0160797.1 Sensor histidine kinase YpdA [Pedobacter sp. Bi27]CAH0279689.1 Sensor histidine kinase YpdA [Pedobacter sp. Bi36]
MKTIKTVSIHILCWILVLGYFYGGYLIDGTTFSKAALNISMNFIQVIEFYICYLWVYPRFLKKNKVLQLIGGILFTIGVFIALRYLIEEVLYLKWLGFHNYDDGTTAWAYITDNIYWSIGFIVTPAAVYGIEQSFKSEQVNRKLKEEVVKAELSFLKSQINPHFLYNTLNYVYSLAIPVSDQLANAILRLSDLMRYTLNDSPDGKVSLDKEVEYLESYVALFKMRFEPKFYVDFTTEGIANQKIASLILIPFVENALKHGVVNDEAQPVRIKLKVQNKRLSFEVSNKISHAQKDHSSGVGMVNIHRRLDLIYPEKHELLISNNGNTYKSTLILNL